MVTRSHLLENIGAHNRSRVVEFITHRWASGDPIIVSKGTVHFINKLPGFVVVKDGDIIGAITYAHAGGEIEIVSLDSASENKGVGTHLVEAVVKVAREMNLGRVWLLTTNDNIRAIRFYQKRGFDLCAFYKDEIEEERKIKPGIPMFGEDGIPIKHALEFELKLR